MTTNTPDTITPVSTKPSFLRRLGGFFFWIAMAAIVIFFQVSSHLAVLEAGGTPEPISGPKVMLVIFFILFGIYRLIFPRKG